MVRVRFAPSPTGYLHAGNARTAILNYLFSKKENGVFILRIEDTDRERSNPFFLESIIEDLSWLKIRWDEGPYFQSERLKIYESYAERMIRDGFAYRCFCSKERLSELRKRWIMSKEPPRYDGKCRNLTESEIRRLESAGEPYVVRFLSPQESVSFEDGIFGEINFPATYVDDFILIKADKTPSYNFAAVIDDMLMDITHVIRGRDHISNTPKQILLFKALGRPHPIYFHHPLLLEKDRRPLSKREGSREIRKLREMGIIPEAIINYLGVLGRKVERELMSPDELIDSFSIHSFSRSDEVFDFEKLLWFNKQHIRGLPAQELGKRAGLSLDERIIDLLKDNVETLTDLRKMMAIFENPEIEEEGIKFLKGVEDAKKIAGIIKESVKNGERLSLQSLKGKIKDEGIPLKKENIMAIRILLTGKMAGPPIDRLLDFIPVNLILGRIECFERN